MTSGTSAPKIKILAGHWLSSILTNKMTATFACIEYWIVSDGKKKRNYISKFEQIKTWRPDNKPREQILPRSREIKKGKYMHV